MDCSAVVPNPPGHSVAKRREIYNWLSAPDYQLKHRNSYKEREELSGLWFLHGDRFQEWKRKPGSCLWLQGKSGAGKTILCSAIIEDISRYCKPSPSLAISYFYFDFNSKDIRTHSVLRALIKQLSLQCASTPDTLAKLFSDNKDGERSPSPEELKSTVKSIIGSFDGVYIIFDALDECPDRHDFLELLEEFHGWDSDKIHLLATSRSELDILKTMDRLGSYDVPMDENLVADDICVYVSKRIDRDSRFKIYSTHEKNMIETALINGAHGM
ncbi:hypothetical protein JB92DRAFT_2742061 [Gautieria morchelliformis]|nr:hypothetical protein JB92DRAFT_2742061 [Gautieria morchelliformis]